MKELDSTKCNVLHFCWIQITESQFVLVFFVVVISSFSTDVCLILLAKNAKDDVILWNVYVCVESTCVIKSAIKNIFSWSSESMSR